MADYDTRRAAATEFARRFGERLARVAAAATPDKRSRALHHADVAAAADAYCDAFDAYVREGGEPNRNALRATADAALAAWRVAVNVPDEQAAA